MEKTSWINSVRNQRVLHRVNEQRNILDKIETSKASWIGHSLRRNCILKHVIEEKIEVSLEVMGRRERRRKLLLENLKETKEYCKLEEGTPEGILWRIRYVRNDGPVTRHTME
jgi:hypothetical protein